MLETIIVAFAFIYLILGFIIASSLAALGSGTGSGWSFLVWLMTIFLWLPYLVKVILKLFGPLALEIVIYPFRRLFR